MPAVSLDAEYGVGINNRFALLNIDIDDDVEAPAGVVAGKESKKTKAAKPGTAPTVSASKDVAHQKTTANRTDKTRPAASATTPVSHPQTPAQTAAPHGIVGGGGPRAPHGSVRGGGAPRGTARPTNQVGRRPDSENSDGVRRAPGNGFFRGGHQRSAPAAQTGEESASQGTSTAMPSADDKFVRSDYTRPPRRGFGQGYAGRGERVYRENKHPYERHSGDTQTGVRSVEKREGRGQYNWGHTTEGEKDNEPTEVTETAEPTPTEETPAEDAVNGNVGKEAEPKLMTLDEFKASMEKERLRPQYETRKPDTKLGRDVKVLKKQTEEELAVENNIFYPKMITEEKIKSSGRQKHLVEVDYSFPSLSDPMRGGGRGRGGRGGGFRRGGGGMHAGRDGAQGHIPDLMDSHAFPELA